MSHITILNPNMMQLVFRDCPTLGRHVILEQLSRLVDMCSDEPKCLCGYL